MGPRTSLKGKLKIKVETDFWERWDIEEVNQMEWTADVPGSAKKEKSPRTSKVKSTQLTTNIQYYSDPYAVKLPREFADIVVYWKRPHEFFPPDEENPDNDQNIENQYENIKLFNDDKFDLFQYNTHLVGCLFYCHIMNTFESLFQYGKFDPTDFAEFGFQRWHPMNHIYANSTVVDGEPHEPPELNTFGKYVVRLYHCGKWRMIIVDDRLPVDVDDNILVPIIRKENLIELWPALLAKAILKLNSCKQLATPEFYADYRPDAKCDETKMVCCRCTEREEPRLFPPIESDLFADVSAVSALTSWVPLKFNFFDKTDEEIWSFLLENLDLFRYEELKSKSKDGSKSRKSTATLRTAKSSNSTVSSSTRTIIREERYSTITMNLPKEDDFVICVSTDISNEVLLTSDEIKDKYNIILLHAQPVELALIQIRDLPYNKRDPVPALEEWKKFRWIEWAKQRGIYEEELPNTHRYLKCMISPSRNVIVQQRYDGEWYDTKTSATQPTDAVSRKSVKGKTPKTVQFDPTVWLNFNNLLTYLSHAWVYYRSNKYDRNIFITNEPGDSSTALMETEKPQAKATKSKSGKLGKKSSVSPRSPKSAKSVKSTISRLKSVQQRSQLLETHVEEEDDFPEKQYVIGSKFHYTYLLVDNIEDTSCLITFENLKSCKDIISYVVCEHFLWQQQYQEVFFSIVAMAATTVTVIFPKGRHLYRLQFGSDNFCLHLRTNGNIFVGRLDELFDKMVKESQRFLSYLQNLFDAIRTYMESVGQPDFVEHMVACRHSIFLYGIDDYVNNKQIRNYIYDTFIRYLFKFLRQNRDGEGKSLMTKFLVYPNWQPHPAPFCDHKLISYNMQMVYNKLKRNNCKCDRSDGPFAPDYVDRVREYSATKIQAYMKMWYVNKLLEYHSKEDEKYEMFKVALQDFYQNYCLFKKPDIYDVIRKVMCYTFKAIDPRQLDMIAPLTCPSPIGTVYEFFPDFYNIINMAKHSGKLDKLARNQWHLITVGCFYCHSKRPTKYYVDCYVVSPKRVWCFYAISNNDTGELTEIKRKFPVFTLTENKNGYLLFVYMFNKESIPMLQWKIRIVYNKHESPFHSCNNITTSKSEQLKLQQISEEITKSLNGDSNVTLHTVTTTSTTTTTTELDECDAETIEPAYPVYCKSAVLEEFEKYFYIGQYWPFSSRLVCRFITRISEATLCSIFFNCTNLKAIFKLIVYEIDSQRIITEEMQRGSIIVLQNFMDYIPKEPSGVIPYSEEEEESKNPSKQSIHFTFYVIEVFLLNKWELTDEEITNIHQAQHDEIDYLIHLDMLYAEEEMEENLPDDDTFVFMYPSYSDKEDVVARPYWSLEIAYPKDKKIFVERDRTQEEQMIRLKKGWKRTGKLDIGAIVQNEFILNRKRDETRVEKCRCINLFGEEIFIYGEDDYQSDEYEGEDEYVYIEDRQSKDKKDPIDHARGLVMLKEFVEEQTKTTIARYKLL